MRVVKIETDVSPIPFHQLDAGQAFTVLDSDLFLIKSSFVATKGRNAFCPETGEFLAVHKNVFVKHRFSAIIQY